MASQDAVVLILGLLLVAACRSQVPSPGRCPKVPVKPWFQLNRRFFAAFQIDNTCVSANYALNIDGSIRVENRGYSPNRVRYITAVGDAFSPDPHQAAKIKVRFSPYSPYQDYWVLDTDYDSFSIVYSCTDSPKQKTKNEFCWILTRRPYALHPALINRIYSLLLAYGINPGNFLPPTQQKFCPRYDTIDYLKFPDIVSENGILILDAFIMLCRGTYRTFFLKRAKIRKLNWSSIGKFVLIIKM